MATPIEAAAVGVIAAMLLIGLSGRLSLKLMLESVNITAMTLLVLVARQGAWLICLEPLICGNYAS